MLDNSRLGANPIDTPLDLTKNLYALAKRVPPWVVAAFLYLAVILIMYWPVVIGIASLKTAAAWPPGPLFVVDPAAGGPITLPMEILAAHAWASGQFPLWLPTQGLGLTLGGNQAAAWFLPEIIFHIVFPHNFSIWNLTRLFGIGIGFYLVARELRISPLAAILVGLFTMLAGPVPPNINLGMLNPLMVLPFLLIFTLRLARDKGWHARLSNAAAVALLTVLMLTAGFDEVLPLLYLLDALVFVFSANWWGRELKDGLQATALFVTAGVVGAAGSAIATLSLLTPLTSYFSYQATTSYLSHVPSEWLATLLDPDFFGRAMAAGQGDMGQSVWALGNPILWILVVVAIAGLLRRGRTVLSRQVWWLFVAVTLFGVLAYSNALGVLSALQLPPFNLVLSVRFLSFMWWPCAALLAGIGLCQLPKTGRAWIAIATLLPIVILIAATVGAVSGSDPGLLSQSHEYLRKFFLEASAALTASIGVLAISLTVRPRYLSALAWVAGFASLLLLLPTNYFPARSSSIPSIQAAAQYLRRHGLADGVYAGFGTVNFEMLPSAYGIREISEWGVFYPRAYALALSRLFPSPPPESGAGVLFLAAPSAQTTLAPAAQIGPLAALGVSGLLSEYPIPDLTSILSVSPFAPPADTAALAALAGVYERRPDLEAAFPVTSRTLVPALLRWAEVYGTTTDSAHTILAPYRSAYIRMADALTANRVRGRDLWVVSPPRISGIRVVGPTMIASEDGREVYLYRFSGLPRMAWAPRKVVPVRSPANVWGHRTLRTLRTTAFVPQNAQALAPAEQVRVLKYSLGEERQTMTLSARRPGLVVLRLQYTRNESVLVNGAQRRAAPVDGLFVGIRVPAGTSTVIINYLTPRLWIAWLVSVLTTIGLLVCMAWLPFVRRPRREGR